MEIGNYYEILRSISNWAPHKLMDINSGLYTFESLNNQLKSVITEGFREIPISQSHLKRIGFEDEVFQDVYVFPMFQILGDDLLNLSHIYFGHIIIHKSELVNFRKTYNEAQAEILEKYKTDGEITVEFIRKIRIKMKNITTVNELFKRLDSYDIIVLDEDKVITG